MMAMGNVVNSKRIIYDARRNTYGDAQLSTDWNATAKGLLKAEMVKRGLTYKALVERFAEQGTVETEVNLRNKISRGGFSAGFFVQCLRAIGVSSLHLD